MSENKNRQPQSGNVITKDGDVVNIVSLLGGGEPVTNEIHDINSFSPKSGLIIGEDGKVYDLVDLITAGKNITPTENRPSNTIFDVAWKNPEEYENPMVGYLASVMRYNDMGLFIVPDTVYAQMLNKFEEGILIDITGLTFTVFEMDLPAHEVKSVSLLYLTIMETEFPILRSMSSVIGKDNDGNTVVVSEAWIVSETISDAMINFLSQFD
ncbi:hypothetical protein KU719_06350 [Streptococcus equi subsp. zooepidemicus]|uniref:hypothetical protein n=1 Tax=Streptococcus equi TaxID=1336 RepID=UPI001E4284FA|nr:hypothetical protein [Streptococcus equi]MCD3389040.1 hypothetical protein [Streptococcus equi subsp. zooepidemicus]